MKVCGIIAEYNPFHNGHLYHFTQSQVMTEADYTIAIIGGNFMQRGAPALLDKYARTHAALTQGFDLVIELPTFYATGSAEYFASGAIALLNQLNVVDHVSFGSECGDINILDKIASIIVDAPPKYTEYLHQKLKAGMSYPTARTNALLQVSPELSASLPILSSPNNILGIEYIKAMKNSNSTIIPTTTKRLGSDYHDQRLSVNQSSATALRHALSSGQSLDSLENHMPEESLTIMKEYRKDNPFVYLDDFSGMLHYKLLSEQSKGYSEYIDVSSDLSDKILNNLYQFTTISAFCDLLKTKNMTYTRISRSLLHILLNLKTSDLKYYIDACNYVPYARVLGFKKNATPLLNAIKKESSIPLITKLADAKNILEGPALSMLEKDIETSNIYYSFQSSKTTKPMKNEYTTPLVII